MHGSWPKIINWYSIRWWKTEEVEEKVKQSPANYDDILAKLISVK